MLNSVHNSPDAVIVARFGYDVELAIINSGEICARAEQNSASYRLR